MKSKMIIIALMLFGVATGAFAQKKVTVVVNDLPALEAAWVAGGAEYRVAVNKAADAYAAKMNTHCQGLVDAKAAIVAYGVHTPRGTEAARDRIVKLQVATLACMGKYDDGIKRAALLRM